jgi:hypothetical protein
MGLRAENPRRFSQLMAIAYSDCMNLKTRVAIELVPENRTPPVLESELVELVC